MAIYDLKAFSARLSPEHAFLGKELRRWIDAHSISTDLTFAADCVSDALRLHQTGRSSLDNACVALAHDAVLGYARALERRSNHRGYLKLTSHLSTSAREMHAKLVELRDEALAHFGPAGDGRPWAEDHGFF